MTPAEVVRFRSRIITQMRDHPFHWPPDEIPSTLQQMIERVGRLNILAKATPFYWSAECEAMSAAYNLPSHVVADQAELLPFPIMLWVMEGGKVALVMGSKQSVTGDADALGLSPDPITYSVGADPGGPRLGSGHVQVLWGWFSRENDWEGGWGPFERWPTGIAFPDEYEAHRYRVNLVGSVLSMLSFAQSRWVSLHPVKPRSDASSARLAKRNVRVEEPEVIVVTLRAPVPRQRDSDSSDTTVHWRHRWMVRGHHRAQWYPSLQAHKVMWIAPHVKGPAEAPMKPQVYAVVR